MHNQFLESPIVLSGPIFSVFFLRGSFLDPQPCASCACSDGFWRGAALDCCCPRTHRRFNVYIASTTLDDGAVRRGGPPQIPKIPASPARCSISTLRFFPDSPKHKKALQGLGTASGGVGFLRDLGLNSKRTPTQRGGKDLTGTGIMATFQQKQQHVRGSAMVRSLTRYCLSPFRDWQNRGYGLITRADGKRMW